MNMDINSNFDKVNENFWTDKKPYQIVCILMAFVVAICVMLVLSPKIGTIAASYVIIILACPFGYVGFFNKNGLDFVSYRKIKKSNVKNGKLMYKTQIRNNVYVANNKRGRRK